MKSLYHSCYIISLFALIFITQQCSCKKDDPVPAPVPVDYRPNTIFGKVVDKTTGAGVAHARVYLRKAKSVLWGTPSWVTTATQYSDTLGNFSFAAQQHSDTVYAVYATKDLFFDDGNNETLISPQEIGYAKQVRLQPMAWLKLHLKNINPFDDYDQIGVNSPAGGGTHPFQGKTLDTLIYSYPLFGNQITVFYTYVTKDNKQVNKQEQIYTPSFDTTLFNIFY